MRTWHREIRTHRTDQIEYRHRSEYTRVFASFCASARNDLFYTRITARPDRAIASYNYT